MNIGIIGATGNIGQRTLIEALNRGHHVTAFTRNISLISEERKNVSWKEADVFDLNSIAAAMEGLDVLISLYQPGNASKDMADTVRQSVQTPTVYATVAGNLLKAMAQYPALRLIVVGGAGSLEIEPGRTLADTTEELHATLEELGLPREYALAVRGHRDALNTYRLSNRRWTYLSPAENIYPGERTGRFRLGGDQPVRDADGKSRISFEDCAIALIDEAELPQFVQRRFTIGY
ncbi:NAD(P)H-binding protein [Chitinophaga varians]|uniref:NAD(P)H-binding protein n=1 Tax=Chitinophaga varians TaxID=2202339 RepID=A0A847RNS2_9BACT|nr:NAD(P)H-binding protein [Chitinophaga varians]NLR63284.1 NAD(P)H-binding protein [Chitinophaga varians]